MLSELSGHNAFLVIDYFVICYICIVFSFQIHRLSFALGPPFISLSHHRDVLLNHQQTLLVVMRSIHRMVLRLVCAGVYVIIVVYGIDTSTL